MIAVSDNSGNLVGSVNRYDEYGNPQGGAITGRFGYTGQMFLPEYGLYDYRARTYHPGRGRFMQTDPIGFGGGMNAYAYVGNEPVNLTDPSGLTYTSCTGSRLCVVPRPPNGGYGGSFPLGASCASCAQSSSLGPSGAFEKVTRWTLVDSNTGAFFGYKYNFGYGSSTLATPFFGPTFGYSPSMGRRIPGLYDQGRVNSGRPGGFDVALGDADMIASLNGVPELGAQSAFQVILTMGFAHFSPFGVPLPVGGGWRVSYNPTSGWTTFNHTSGMAFRYLGGSDQVRLDIPSGFRLPGGAIFMGPRGIPESVHYPRQNVNLPAVRGVI